jgi:hypothetical protein
MGRNSIFEKSALWYKNKIRAIYEKFLNKNLGKIRGNKEISFDCVVCGKKVNTFIGTACGITLLCPNCFNKKYVEFLNNYKKRVLFENIDKNLRDIWMEYFKNLAKI